MADRRFRFGVIAGQGYTGPEWLALARRSEELGYSTLLMPDELDLFAPLPAAAAAAAVTTTLRVGTFVLASTVRPPRTAAWEAHSVAVLTDHRFDLGIGTGNQWMNQAAVDEIGRPPTTPAQRLALIERTVQYLRELEATHPIPVMIAAGGRGARTLAGRLADIVTLAHNPLADHQDVKQMIADIAETAGDRSEQIEYNMEVLVVGDSIPQRLTRLVGEDLHALTAADSLYLLRGEPQQMADQIQHRRDIFGYSYITVNDLYLEQFAPVVELLYGV